jgi:hypothetical protein
MFFTFSQVLKKKGTYAMRHSPFFFATKRGIHLTFIHVCFLSERFSRIELSLRTAYFSLFIKLSIQSKIYNWKNRFTALKGGLSTILVYFGLYL